MWHNMVLPIQTGYFNLNLTTSSIDLSTFPSYSTMFSLADTKFFGLSQIILYLGQSDQIISFQSQNSAAVEIGYSSL
jgi:hypothetical protein